MGRCLLRGVVFAVLSINLLLGLSLVLGQRLPSYTVAAEVDARLLLVDVQRGTTLDVSPEHTPFATTPTTTSHRRVRYQKPVWSPDGTRIAFYAHSIRQPRAAIGVMNLQTHTTRIYAAIAESAYPLYWSPDGTQILFTYTGTAQRLTGQNTALLDVRSGEHTFVTGVGGAVSPTWSPDGRTITYRVMGDVHLLAQADDSTWAQSQVVSGGFHAAEAWSADGGRLSLIANTGQKVGVRSAVKVVEPGSAAAPTRCQRPQPKRYAVPSLHGTYRAMMTRDHGLTVVRVATCAVVFTYPTESTVPPVWASDDTLILADADGIVRVNVTNGHTRHTETGAPVRHLSQR